MEKLELVEYADYVIKRLGLLLEKVDAKGFSVENESPLACYRTKRGHPPILLFISEGEKSPIKFCVEILGQIQPTDYYASTQEGVIEALLAAHLHIFSLDIPEILFLQSKIWNAHTGKHHLYIETVLRDYIHDDFEHSYLDVISGGKLVVTKKKLKEHIREVISLRKKYSYPRPMPLRKASYFLKRFITEYELSLYPLRLEDKISDDITFTTEFPRALIVERDKIFVTEAAYGNDNAVIALGTLYYGKGKCPIITYCERVILSGHRTQSFSVSYYFADEPNLMGYSFLADICYLRGMGYLCYIDREHETPLLVVSPSGGKEDISLPYAGQKVVTPEEWKFFKGKIFFFDFFHNL